MPYSTYSSTTAADIVRLRRRLESKNLPLRRTDSNLVLGTWNLRNFGGVFNDFEENPGSPKRNLRAMACIAEIVRQFDVIAIQEVKRDTSGVRLLVDKFLGTNWGLILSDVTVGSKGNSERLAYIYDTRRVTPSGLAGEIVLAPGEGGDAVEQFDRTPYIVGFRSGSERFALLTVHIRFGNAPQDRIPELKAFAEFTAKEIRDRARTQGAEEANLIVLGDFNIDKRVANPLFDAFVSQGLMVPPELRDLTTTFGTQAKHYDQIGWFMGEMNLMYKKRAGVIDFMDCIFQELDRRQVSDRVSDHFPLWVEFGLDRSPEALARVLGLDPDAADPFESIPD